MSRGWLIEIEYSLTAGPYQSPVNDSLKAKINFEGGEEEILYITKCVCVCVCASVRVCGVLGRGGAGMTDSISSGESRQKAL